MFWYSSSYWLYMLPAILVVMLANLWVNATYRRWGRVQNSKGVNGIETARRLLSYGGLSEIHIEGIGRQMGDHYDPRSRTLRLSANVARDPSVASMAIAAHEIGHAMQHREGYLPLQFRTAIVPAANFGSTFGWILILAGLLLRIPQVAWLGVWAFSLGAIFALATIPVELNASARAKRLLTQNGLLGDPRDRKGVSAMLTAAALTYVAALAAALLQLLYYVTLIGGIGGRRRR